MMQVCAAKAGSEQYGLQASLYRTVEDLIIVTKAILRDANPVQKGRDMLLRGELTRETGKPTVIVEQSSELIGVMMEETALEFVATCRQNLSSQRALTYWLFIGASFTLFIQHYIVWKPYIEYLQAKVRSELKFINIIPFALIAANPAFLKNHELMRM